jgi:ADP-ribosylglycohydrolase/uncharacterized protein (DUF1810 family)
MLGAIVGDIVDSVYEFNNTKDYNFHMVTPRSRFTDDTVMTLAVAEWLTEDKTHSESYLIKCMQELGRKYPNVGYGGTFRRWLYRKNPKTYNSWGNGSAMRVSPVGYFAHNLGETMELAKTSAEVTHHHPEGIKGAQAIASAIYLARQGKAKKDIQQYVSDTFDYDLNRTIDLIRPAYTFDVSCMGSVPEAIIAFLDGNDFEDTIRKAVSIGGDSDTFGAMAGSIAQAMYGMPKPLAGYCYECLTPELRSILDEFEDMTDHHTDDPFNLERFLTMQTPVYKTVLEEMRNGYKRGHYMWYIFPQLRGLGHSANSYIYGLADIEEAKAYLHNPLLGRRLRETIKVLIDRNMEDISKVLDRDRTDNINTLKFRSCLTLFDEASPNDIFNEALQKFFSSGKDDLTLQTLS